jgi:hypothetical protein
MTVYVDPLRTCLKNKNWRSTSSCHLFADTTEELHTFAKRLGLKAEWFQPISSYSHYDLTENKRRKAVQLGAVEDDGRILMEKIRGKRKKTT